MKKAADCVFSNSANMKSAWSWRFCLKVRNRKIDKNCLFNLSWPIWFIRLPLYNIRIDCIAMMYCFKTLGMKYNETKNVYHWYQWKNTNYSHFYKKKINTIYTIFSIKLMMFKFTIFKQRNFMNNFIRAANKQHFRWYEVANL